MLKKLLNRLILLLLAITFPTLLSAQKKLDVGVIGGASFYLGDINQENPFYSPGYNAGGLLRVNIDKRTSVRLKGLYTTLSGSDNDFDTQVLGRMPTTFAVSLLNMSLQVEYNFIPYETGNNKYLWSPYIFAGFGYSGSLSASSNASVTPENHLAIPFGVGLKFNAGRRFSYGAEWAFNKSFSDRVDAVVPRLDPSFMFKNDWYNFASIFITYKFFKFAEECPAYN